MNHKDNMFAPEATRENKCKFLPLFQWVIENRWNFLYRHFEFHHPNQQVESVRIVHWFLMMMFLIRQFRFVFL